MRNESGQRWIQGDASPHHTQLWAGNSAPILVFPRCSVKSIYSNDKIKTISIFWYNLKLKDFFSFSKSRFAFDTKLCLDGYHVRLRILCWSTLTYTWRAGQSKAGGLETWR